MRVWVVFYDYGRDGFSDPAGVFSTKKKAEDWLKGTDHSMSMPQSSTLEIDEFEVDNPDFWKTQPT